MRSVTRLTATLAREYCLILFFFGGGTPSLLSGEEFLEIVSHIRSAFSLADDVEFTIESNPKTITAENLEEYIKAGVNRISIGLQSVNENELSSLGRVHNYSEFLESYNLARKMGVKNINVDLMYGIPEQTKKSFLETLQKVTALSPEHISVYGLILEEGTPLYKNAASYKMPSEDEECDMYYLAADYLRKAGYSHYEISNYAKPGYECKHNLKYWNCDEYIGVGLSAYSYFDGKRYGNTADRHAYLLGGGGITIYDEPVTDETLAYEYVMLGLRLAEGFSLRDYKERFKSDFLCGREEIIKRFIDCGYLLVEGGRIFLTDRGLYVSNSIINELI